jgi:hypothetical protein
MKHNWLAVTLLAIFLITGVLFFAGAPWWIVAMPPAASLISFVAVCWAIFYGIGKGR